ncbi:MAG: DUF2760 domain-containing protein [Gammaproteobacteria bacterium]|nr:DUF2760 domain-containing protein [Gammaproteobacteria bacterium]
MNTDINIILTNLDVLHYGLIGVSLTLGLVVILLLVVKSRDGQGDAVIRQDTVQSAGAQDPSQKPSPQFKKASSDSALQLLGLLQHEARLIDFLEEETQSFSDAEVGAAARVVHEGARKVLRENFSILPVRDEVEGTRLTLESGFNNQEVRLSGNVIGEPPFAGQLVHRGWRVNEVSLPKVSSEHDLSVVAPAEVEL